MKIEAEGEFDLAFKEVQASIVEVRDIETNKYGTKPVATLKDMQTDALFQVFLNNYSMSNLIDAWGDEDNTWKGKLVNVVRRVDERYDAEMIVLTPVQ